MNVQAAFRIPKKQPAPFCTDILAGMTQETAYLTRIRFQAAPQTTISTLPLPTQRPPSIMANDVPAASSSE